MKNLKRELLGQLYDELLLTADRQYKHYKANEDRIILKDGLLFRIFVGETDSVNYYKVVVTKQLVNEVLHNLHGEFGRQPGITKTIIAYREVLLPKHGTSNQEMGNVMRAMHQRIADRQQIHSFTRPKS